jgi:hypothetical protein
MCTYRLFTCGRPIWFFLLLINIYGSFYCTHEVHLAEMRWVLTSSVSISLLCRRGDGGFGKSANKATVNSQTTLSVLLVACFPFVRKTQAYGFSTLRSTHPFQFFKQRARCHVRVHSNVVMFSFPAVSSINMADSRTSEMGTALAPLKVGS